MGNYREWEGVPQSQYSLLDLVHGAPSYKDAWSSRIYLKFMRQDWLFSITATYHTLLRAGHPLPLAS